MTVQVPLTNIAGLVTSPGERLADGGRSGIQGLVIVEDAVCEPILPGQEAGTIRATHRTAGHGVAEIDALFGEPIKVRRLHILVSRVSGRLGTPLIGKYKDEIWFVAGGFLRRRPRQPTAQGDRSPAKRCGAQKLPPGTTLVHLLTS